MTIKPDLADYDGMCVSSDQKDYAIITMSSRDGALGVLACDEKHFPAFLAGAMRWCDTIVDSPTDLEPGSLMVICGDIMTEQEVRQHIELQQQELNLAGG